MSQKTRIKKPVVPIPQTWDEAAQFLAHVGRAQRAIDTINGDLNAKVEKLTSIAMAEAKVHQAELEQLLEGLFVYAESHRQELTDDGKHKTVEFPTTGTVSWRLTPPAVSLRNVGAVLKTLKSLGLKRLIRFKEEVDKEAMPREPEVAQKVRGVKIGQREEFVVQPTELSVEIASNADQLRKVAAKR
jgi:phage host-nuclease inhibitor protein Gam